MINHLWQSTVFAIVAGLLTLAFRKNRAQVRYWLWFSASLKFFLPLSLLIGLGSMVQRTPATGEITTPVVSAAIEQVTEPFPETVSLAASAPDRRAWIPGAILAIWACGLAAIAAIRLRGWLRIRAALRASVPIDIPSPVAIRSAAGLLEPGVVGLFRSVLLVPEGIAERLTPRQLEAVLAHELCHVHRRDNLTSAIHMIVEALFWFHPLVWWIGAHLVEERERACDEGVLSLGNEPQVYAEAILNVCKLYVESPLVCVSGVTGSDLKKRIEAIMTNRMVFRLNFVKKAALAVAAATALAVPIIVGIMNAPRLHAQSPQLIAPPVIETPVPPPVIAKPKARPQIVAQRTAPPPPPKVEVQGPPAPVPAFEVASIKPCAPGDTAVPRTRGGGRSGGGLGRGGPSPDRLTMGCQTLINLMKQSYITFARGHVNDPGYTLVEGGPAWVRTERYQVTAKADGTPGQEMMRGPMLQALLEDRFQLKIHRETREVPVYALTVAKGGPKLDAYDETTCVPLPMPPPSTPVPAAGQKPYCGMSWFDGNGATAMVYVSGRSLDDFSQVLGTIVDRPVADKTGIAGKFVFHLEYTPDETTPGGFRANRAGEPAAAAEPAGGPSIFTAIQKYGLRLEPAKGPRDFIVIDRAEKPSEN